MYRCDLGTDKQHFAVDATGIQPQAWSAPPRPDGCSWMLLTAADENKVIIKAVAFRGIFRVCAQTFIQVELLFLGWIVSGGHI